MNAMYTVVAERFIRLVLEEEFRTLSGPEQAELEESKTFLQNYFWEKEKLQAMSYLAYATNDNGWQHEICAQVERLQGE
ncbi:hypothetical protein JCM19037_2958 [Geomicrobium sp. JCM 19037]|nr:hypothetical protein JCM19037_2958 [Geomicrobium sp. JCM 19037]